MVWGVPSVATARKGRVTWMELGSPSSLNAVTVTLLESMMALGMLLAVQARKDRLR